ncbi:7TM-DISM domain-containing protein, partial [Oleiphilus sp. HI0079]
MSAYHRHVARRSISKIILAVVLLLCAQVLWSAENTLKDGADSPLPMAFDYFEDPYHLYTFEQIQALPEDRWSKAMPGQGSFGFTSSQYWIKTLISNKTANTQNMVLEVDYLLLDDVVFKATTSDGRVLDLATGDSRNFYPRHIDHPSILFNFQLESNQDISVISRVKTQGSMLLPL